MLSMGTLDCFTCGTTAVICADVKTSVTVRVCAHAKSLSDSVCVCVCVWLCMLRVCLTLCVCHCVFYFFSVVCVCVWLQMWAYACITVVCDCICVCVAVKCITCFIVTPIRRSLRSFSFNKMHWILLAVFGKLALITLTTVQSLASKWVFCTVNSGSYESVCSLHNLVSGNVKRKTLLSYCEALMLSRL